MLGCDLPEAFLREKLRKFDKGLARGEAAIAVIVLLALIGVAALQSLLRNMADAEVDWANSALSSMAWADPFMEKATLWLAMLGASLATHYDKHIAIDVLSRIAKPKARAAMRGVVSLFAGLTSFYFARVVLGALMAKSVRIPGDYAVYDADFETVHVCLGSAEDLARATMERPDFFCSVRGFFDGLGLTVQTPERMMDLLVPAMFLIIGTRLLAIGVGAFMRIPEGGIPDEELGGHEGEATGAENVAASEENTSENEADGADDDSEAASDDSSEDSASDDGASDDSESDDSASEDTAESDEAADEGEGTDAADGEASEEDEQ